GLELACLELLLHRGVAAEQRRIAGKHVFDPLEALVTLLEVFAEPLEDRAHLELARARAIARGIAEKAPHTVFELLFELVRRERLRTQRRAADAGADDGRVHARLAVLGAQLLVLDPVEIALLAKQREERLLPRRTEQGDVFDRLQLRV